jgi:DNA gyrase inhibitor GyrI
MKKMIFLALGLLVGVTFLVAGCQVTRGGYESAPYEVVRRDAKFELRDYPALKVVETSMAQAGQEDDGSFRRLFAYITGANEGERKIAMTTPVLMSGSDSNRSMAFVLPAGLEVAGAPQPIAEAVAVREVPAGRFAVLRFSGGRSVNQEKEVLDRLRAWVKQERLVEASTPVYAYFDPPWTPAFLRRNEVMLRIVTGEGPRPE